MQLGVRLPGIDPGDAFGESQHTGKSQPVKYLLAAPLVGNQSRMAQHRQVTGSRRRRTARHRRKVTRAHLAIGQGMDDRHPPGMPERFEHLSLALQRHLSRVRPRHRRWFCTDLHGQIIRSFAKYAIKIRSQRNICKEKSTAELWTQVQ